MIKINPIGRVENEIRGRKCVRKCKETISKIRLNAKYTEGLEGIEKYSFIYIIFWMHKVPAKERKRLKVPYIIEGERLEAGIFSTRVQFRENPIGITLVELLRREENVLFVRGLEAMNRTPVLDIKPYTRHPFNQLFLDMIIRFAPWANKRPTYNLR